MAKQSRRSQKKTKRSSSDSVSRVDLSPEERQVALSELGVSEQDLESGTPVWAYLVGGGMILGALLLSIRLADR